jgi:hypothetical protein
VPIRPSVSTVNSVGRSCGRVTRQKRCQAFAPSIIAASCTSPPRFCSAAMNSSMKVPLVVKTAISTKALIATEGPANQSHQLTPSRSWSVRNAGPVTPIAPRALWTTPLGSWNQAGPSIPSHDSARFTAPVCVKRNSHTTVMATELVTDGK